VSKKSHRLSGKDNKKFYYQAFGLGIVSEFELFQLQPASGSIKPELEIVIGKVAKEGAHANKQSKDVNLFQISQQKVGRFLITNGNKITVDPEKGADLQTIKLYLLGSCMGAILQQRGDLVLHGNAIKFQDKAVIVVAPSGVGKSTLAGEFYRRGYKLLADDVCAIDPQGYVQPSYPYLKLWQAAVDKLEFDHNELIRIRLQKEKFYFPLNEAFYQNPLPVTAIYVLNKGHEKDFKLIKLSGLEKLQVLRRNTYRPSYTRRFKIIHKHVEKFAKMLKTVKVSRIIRPEKGFHLEELAQIIIDDVKSHETPRPLLAEKS